MCLEPMPPGLVVARALGSLRSRAERGPQLLVVERSLGMPLAADTNSIEPITGLPRENGAVSCSSKSTQTVGLKAMSTSRPLRWHGSGDALPDEFDQADAIEDRDQESRSQEVASSRSAYHEVIFKDVLARIPSP